MGASQSSHNTPASQRKSGLLTGFGAIVRSVDYSPDEKLIVACDHAGCIHFFDAVTRERRSPPITGAQGSLFSVRFNHKSDLVVAGGFKDEAYVYDVAKCLAENPNADVGRVACRCSHANVNQPGVYIMDSVYCAVWSSDKDASRFAYTSSAGVAKIWKTEETIKVAASASNVKNNQPGSVVVAPTDLFTQFDFKSSSTFPNLLPGAAQCCVITPDNTTLICGHDETAQACISRIDLESNEAVVEELIIGDPKVEDSMVVDPKTGNMWQGTEPKRMSIAACPDEFATLSMAISHDGRVLITGYTDGTLRVATYSYPEDLHVDEKVVKTGKSGSLKSKSSSSGNLGQEESDSSESLDGSNNNNNNNKMSGGSAVGADDEYCDPEDEKSRLPKTSSSVENLLHSPKGFKNNKNKKKKSEQDQEQQEGSVRPKSLRFFASGAPHSSSIFSVCFSKDDHFFLTCSGGKENAVRCFQTNSLVQVGETINLREVKPFSATLSPNLLEVAVAAVDRSVHLYPSPICQHKFAKRFVLFKIKSLSKSTKWSGDDGAFGVWNCLTLTGLFLA